MAAPGCWGVVPLKNMATWLYGSARWGLLAAVPGLLTLAEASKDSCKSACGSTYSTILEVLSKEQCRQGCEYFFDGDDTTVAECKRRCAGFSACSVGCDIGYAECREGDWCQGDERARKRRALRPARSLTILRVLTGRHTRDGVRCAPFVA